MKSGTEQVFDKSKVLLSITDLESKVKYANPEFCKIAGYTNEELNGQPHNIVRHPDMPKAAFKDLWSYVQRGQSWMGPVKNKCKNGDYYWVNAYVTPIKDKSGKNIEYQSVRTKLDEHVKKRADNLYSKLNKGETPIRIKYEIDQTLWFQSVLLLLTLASLAFAIHSELNVLITLPFFIVAFLTSFIFIRWRKKYKRVLKEAKDTFDNPLMSYLYSGNNDAIGKVQLALAMRRAEVNAVVGRVTDVSIQASKNGNLASEQSILVSQKLSDQKNESEQIATAINEMSATIQDLARTVVETAQSAEEGQEMTTSGQETIAISVNAINDLSKQLTEVDSMIGKLSDGSNSINTVLSEISSIADQTNLLALNAAIEAARAGEQGRGFAVVAEEVRALAMRTQQSTEEIRTLLTQLQSDSDNAVDAMNKGNELSANCVSLSNEAGIALKSIHKEVSLISDATAQVATAIEEQSVVSEQMSQNIVRINDLAISCEESSQESSLLSSELLEKLSSQEALITQFKR
ncbi:PAS domain-containing methyl-accepting chemotaxis protein [Colwellia sp. RSH04]|uniref:methyl-accepting chemotaxis protein n=1 Tax=Colwellia sp. RSH04 TaxID=2305464 RepID=UPI000E59556D|nr:PAS domain-containing methyl-accepting chemotaxis protein [Colwellia sp. RSH04]RHW76947.1 PAS domain S-box protein [Colwellia sp. RSH04]